MGTVSVGEGKAEATVTIEVQPNARAGEYTLAVQGQAQVPFTKDQKSGAKSTLVSLPSRPITVVVRRSGK
jgi:hypothetical protein